MPSPARTDFLRVSRDCLSSRTTSGGPGIRRATSSAGSTTRCGAQTAHNPVMMLQRHVAGRRSSAPPPIRRSSPPTTRRSRRWTRSRRRDVAAHLVAARRSAPIRRRSSRTSAPSSRLHQSLPIYAGGLGVLAGDHCKEASDLGVPLVGVGFMYPQGYFRQRVSPEGWQQEVYEQLDWDAGADRARAHASTTSRASSSCRSATRSVLVQVWEVQLGRVRLLLLDTDLEQNAAVGSRAVRAALRRRPGHAAAAGDRARPRRRARAARARPARRPCGT